MRKTTEKKTKNAEWMKERKIPIRVLKNPVSYEDLPMKIVLKPTAERGFAAPAAFRFVFLAFKKSLVFGLAVLAVASQSAVFSAFEARVINVTATIEDGIAEHIVINEVYYNVGHRKFCAVDKEKEPRNEWIEIYNPTDAAVDISGWTIEDNNSSDIIPSSPPVPAHGFAVISKNDSTWLFWNIPPEAVKITLGSVIGNGLDNDGDRVILKDNFGNTIDGVSYGTDVSVLNPSVSGVNEGHSIARSPKGYDTDQASDWVDLETPNPGTNPRYDSVAEKICPLTGAVIASGGGETAGDLEEATAVEETATVEAAAAAVAEEALTGAEETMMAAEETAVASSSEELAEESEIIDEMATTTEETAASFTDSVEEAAAEEAALTEEMPDDATSDNETLNEATASETEDNVSDELLADESESAEIIEIIVENDSEVILSEESGSGELNGDENAGTP